MEPTTAQIRARFRRFAADEALISDWVTTEVSSALSLKVRTGALDPARRAAALSHYGDMITRSLRILPVTAEHFAVAARYADRHDLNLRAGDALHLAVAAASGATLLTLDRRLHDACLAVGVAAETL